MCYSNTRKPPNDALHGDAPSLVDVAVIAIHTERVQLHKNYSTIVNTQEAAVMEIH